ncbi:MAG: tRNA (cytidine(34)-2'-O)-methyltransferase [Ilumatobacteraceae bacterium]
MDVVLVAPEIGTNTGNVVRLCANTGARLHLVEPLGFRLDASSLRRAGLDYHELAPVAVHGDLEALVDQLGPRRRLGFSSHAEQRLDDVRFGVDDVLVFGAERHGLTTEQLGPLDPIEMIRIPMRPDNRSMNLANAVAVVVYEAWRQHDYRGAAGGTTSETPAGPTYDR